MTDRQAHRQQFIREIITEFPEISIDELNDIYAKPICLVKSLSTSPMCYGMTDGYGYVTYWVYSPRTSLILFTDPMPVYGGDDEWAEVNRKIMDYANTGRI